MCIADYDAKLERIADRYLDYDVRMVTGTTCWFSLLFDKLLEAAQRRGRRVSTVGELWPNLRVLLGGGVAAAPYLPVIRERVGHEIELIDTYNATEGGVFASTAFGPGLDGMLMIPHRGVFFELMPIEDDGRLSSQRSAREEPANPSLVWTHAPSLAFDGVVRLVVVRVDRAAHSRGGAAVGRAGARRRPGPARIRHGHRPA